MRTADGSYIHRWKGLGVLILTLFIIAIDNTVLNVALPAISYDLQASASDLQWILDIYVLFFASLLLTSGSLSDRYGRKLLLNIGMAIFALGSLGAALSPNTEMLILMRGLTGIGGAAMMPATLSIMTDMFRDETERQKAIMIWSMSFGIGFGFGPVLGGWLVDNLSWEWVFYINLPIAIITLFASARYLPESFDPSIPKEDLVGMGLSIVALFTLIYAIIKAGTHGWTQWDVLLNLAVGALFMTVFILWERRTPHAMMPMKLFKNRSFTIATVVITLVMFGMMGTMYFFSQYLQTIQHYSALAAGALLIPLTLAMTFATMIAMPMMKRFGMRWTTTIGVVASALGMGWFWYMVDVDTTLWIIMTGFVIQGFGIGLAMMPATESIMASLPQSKLGIGSAMNDTARELGGAVSVAVMGAIMNAIYIAATVTLGSQGEVAVLGTTALELIQSSIQGAHAVASTVPNTHLEHIILTTADSAFVDGMRHAMAIGMIVTLLSALLAALAMPSRQIVSTHEELA